MDRFLLSQTEVETLINLGYCKIAEDMISRVGRRNYWEKIASNPISYGLSWDEHRQGRSAKTEHAWRTYGDPWIVVGGQAELFPASETTETGYVHMHSAYSAVVRDIIKRSETQIIDVQILREKREKAEREAFYEDSAIF